MPHVRVLHRAARPRYSAGGRGAFRTTTAPNGRQTQGRDRQKFHLAAHAFEQAVPAHEWLDTETKTIQESRSGLGPAADGTGARATTLWISETDRVAAQRRSERQSSEDLPAISGTRTRDAKTQPKTQWGARCHNTKACLRRADQRWAMDFVADTLAQGRTFRVLTIIDEYTRECLAIETDIQSARAAVPTVSTYKRGVR
jgi:hypothetical protein